LAPGIIRRSRTLRDLRALPKAHLHLHLEGAMRPSTLRELAARCGLPLPSLDGDGSFAAFVAMYRAASAALQQPEDYQRLMLEVAEDAVTAGAVWVEPSAWITENQARKLGLRDEEAVLELLIDAARRAERETGVGIGLMMSTNRTRPPAEAIALARLASRYAGRGVVAFGLADDESRFGPEPFAVAFAVAAAAGLICAPHAGELAGPASVLGALDKLGADRIQHGVRAVENPRLVERLARNGVCLDVCPTSNLMLGVVPSIEAHPLAELLGAGVRLSVNSDDPLFFGAGLCEEYELCRAAFGLNDEALARIAAGSVESSGAPETARRAALAGISEWLAASAGP
jgi:adenosine deaminase